MRSNREYDYFGNVLEYSYDYFASYSSTRTQKVLVLSDLDIKVGPLLYLSQGFPLPTSPPATSQGTLFYPGV